LLIDLQEIDDRIAGLKGRLALIPQRLEDLSSSLREALNVQEALKEDLEKCGKERRSDERELEVQEEKIVKLQEKQLMVKTNEEYQALLSEIATAEDQKERLEDRILNVLEECSGLEEKITVQEKVVFEERRQFDEEEKKLKAEKAGLEGELETVLGRRNEIVSGIEEINLHSYDRLMEFWKGKAVVAVTGGVCRGCFINLPPQKFQEVKKNEDIQLCNQCKRIIYFQEAGVGEGPEGGEEG
jgi:predicted  nucleic acid-binding Zn-ribbon protein